MRIVTICILLTCGFVAWAQQKDGVSVLADKQITSAKDGFCTPGIINQSRARGLEVTYNLSGGGYWEHGDDTAEPFVGQMQSLESMNVKLRVPVLLKPDLKILVGYQYQPQRYSFREIGAPIQPFVGEVNNQPLKSNAFSLYLTKSFDEKYYSAFRVRMGFNGAYDGWVNFDDQYMTFNVIGLFGIKKSDHFEWGVGAVFSRNIRRTLLLPFVMLNKNFNDKWGLETAPPAYILGRYNVNPRTILLFGGEYNSSIFSIEPNSINAFQANDNLVYSINNRSFNMVINLERQIIPWLWLDVKGGFQFNLNSRFEVQIPDTDNVLRFQPPNAPFLQVGIFLSPPDELMQ